MFDQLPYSAETLLVKKLVTGGEWKVNCYLVHHFPSGKAILFDPGDEPEKLIQEIENLGSRVEHILLTHAHHDHVGAAATICAYFGLPCELHKDDLRLLHHAPMYALRFAQRKISLPNSYLTFGGVFDIPFGNDTVRVIHTPGHTPGSVCYLIGNFIFTGDTLLFKHIGRTDLPGGNKDQLYASLNALLAEISTDSILFPGHGPTWTAQEARAWWQESVSEPNELNQFEN